MEEISIYIGLDNIYIYFFFRIIRSSISFFRSFLIATPKRILYFFSRKKRDKKKEKKKKHLRNIRCFRFLVHFFLAPFMMLREKM